MKINIFTSLLVVFSFISCQETTDKTVTTQEQPTLSEAQLIANAHGFENWDQVNQLNFAFNVARGDYNSKRSWQWKPKTGEVTLITATDTVSYNHKQVDSMSIKTDAAFINDKYWFLAPYNLIWDANYAAVSEATKSVDPISGDSLKVITLTYKNEGGYTPGDAYDFYYNKDYTLSSWVYRKGNAKNPSMTTTWQDYKKAGPINYAVNHKDSLQTLNIFISDVKVQ